jgi:hypothetical protein
MNLLGILYPGDGITDVNSDLGWEEDLKVENES